MRAFNRFVSERRYLASSGKLVPRLRMSCARRRADVSAMPNSRATHARLRPSWYAVSHTSINFSGGTFIP